MFSAVSDCISGAAGLRRMEKKMKLFKRTISLLSVAFLTILIIQPFSFPVKTHASGVHNTITFKMDLESIAFTKDSTESDAQRRIRYGGELLEDENELRVDISNSYLNYITTSGYMNGIGDGANMVTPSRQYYACYAVRPPSPGGNWPDSIENLSSGGPPRALTDYPDFGVYVNSSYRDDILIAHNQSTDCLYVYIPMNIIAVGTWDLSSATVAPPKDVIYSGYKYEPSYETITCNGRTLKQYLHYKYEYENNILPGKAIVRIVGYGKYTGSVTRFFTIHFTDVPPTHPYKSAVNWAASEKIATGYTGDLVGTFGVSDKITRGQVAMMLWRAGGKQEPSGNTQVFKDVPVKHKFYKAIQWAYEEEITAGYSDGSFGVNKNCTRGHCVTFLYKDRVKG